MDFYSSFILRRSIIKSPNDNVNVDDADDGDHEVDDGDDDDDKEDDGEDGDDDDNDGDDGYGSK